MNLFVEDGAALDLISIKKIFGYDTHVELLAFIDEIAVTPATLDQLYKWKSDSYNPWMNTSAISCFQKQGFNLFRAKPLSSQIAIFRVIYSYDTEYGDIYVHAIVDRATPNKSSKRQLHCYNYEYDHPISVRIKAEYAALNIPFV